MPATAKPVCDCPCEQCRCWPHCINGTKLPVEYLEADLEERFPGFDDLDYQFLAWEALHRTAGRCGGPAWARSTLYPDWLELQKTLKAESQLWK